MSAETGPGPEFLKQKYDLHNASEVESAAKRTEQRTGEKVSQNPEERIQNYLNRLEHIINPPKLEGHENFDRQARNLEMLKGALHKKFVVQRENIPQEYIKNILLGNFAEQKGYDREKLRLPEIKEYILKMFKEETNTDFEDYQVPEEQKEEVADLAVKDQQASLDRWFDYLTSVEAENYPDEFRYWAFAEVLKLGAQSRERKDFNKRTENTAAPYPELNQQALALVLDEIGRKYQSEPSRIHFDDALKQEDFKRRLRSENFGKIYGWALEYVNSLRLPKERLLITEGKWIEFAQGSDPKILADSLSGFNTGWCIAGEGTAESYLLRSSVSIYFSQDEKDQNSIPRAAIVSDGQRVSEVRGIIQTKEVKQHLDDYITPVVSEKLKTMPGGKEWEQGMEDMKKLAEVHFKHLQGQPLEKDDLLFLYEINHTIQSLGYGKDPRITEIRSQRNPKEDAPIVFECQPEEIAWSQNEITDNTKAYIGSLFPGIFDRLSHIEQIYTSFPETRIHRSKLEIGGKTKKELERELKEKKINIGGYAQDMLDSSDFTTLENPEQIQTIRLKVRDLGFRSNPTTDELYARAKELGLELCSAEVGPHQRLKDMEQPLNDWYWIAMKQIADRGGDPYVFSLEHHEGGLWLSSPWAKPTSEWYLDRELVFCSRKLKS